MCGLMVVGIAIGCGGEGASGEGVAIGREWGA